MSILETFYIMFKSDSKDVKKGAEDAKKSTEQLNQSLKTVNTSTDHVGAAFANMGRSVLNAAIALASVGAILGNIKGAYQYTLGLDQNSRALNVNIETLDAWGRAVQRNGGTAQGFQQSIKSLAQSLNIRNQDAVRLLPMLADTFQKVGPDRSMRWGQKMGLDQSTILLLQQGRREVDMVIARQKELGSVTKQDGEIAQRFNNQWSDMTFALRIAWVHVASEILPVIGKLIDGVTDLAIYMQKHSTAIVGALIGIGSAVLYFNASLLVIPLLIAAAVAAFAILFEDIVAFAKGNNSLIGDLLNKWPKVGEVIKSVFNGIKTTIDYVIEGFRRFKNILKGGDIQHAVPTFEFIQKGMEDAEKTPLMAQTSNSIFNGGNSKATSVYTGPITINTQATDGEEVGTALSRGLKDQLRQVTGSFSDGVMI